MTRRVLAGTAVAALVLVLPFWLTPTWLTTAVFVLIAAIAVTGLNILTGDAGQVSLGHAFFLAAGAYGGVTLAEAGLTSVASIAAAGVIAALFGAMAGPIALRLEGMYLALVTLGLVFVGQHVLFNVPDLSGGPAGRAFPPVSIGSLDFSTDQLSLGPAVIDGNGLYYYFAALLLALATGYAWNLSRTRPGRAMVAVRDRSIAAAIMGVNVARTKIAAFVVSSFLAGVSGALYASYVGFAEPGQWNVLLSIQYVAAIVVGGMGTVSGPLLGAVVVFALPSALKELPFLDEGGTGLNAGDLAAIIYGLLIVGFLVAEPRGLVGVYGRVRRWRLRPVPLGGSPQLVRAWIANRWTEKEKHQ
jgi:branched-chain amino acid transport system permease protein